MAEKCSFRFGEGGPHCQRPPGHEGFHSWASDQAMQERGLKPHPTIEEMERDLLRGGWQMVHFSVWRSPRGDLFRGPHKAWHVWAGTPMCDPK